MGSAGSSPLIRTTHSLGARTVACHVDMATGGSWQGKSALLLMGEPAVGPTADLSESTSGGRPGVADAEATPTSSTFDTSRSQQSSNRVKSPSLVVSHKCEDGMFPALAEVCGRRSGASLSPAPSFSSVAVGVSTRHSSAPLGSGQGSRNRTTLPPMTFLSK
ncbi:hypothetical protein EYF80_044623 [Liparis tanakae]|uniref:Uncharacterized protein n=1 Tax=Liparis tanakae TaxID=230148 RepID=A0A4Z2FWK7_9TELE|nr:hypothetical protein EYF80_044623 [Liparis tanakae]